MRILLIKTSSLGDLIHTLPALSDAKRAIPALQVDWVVEENFVAIPTWHHAVNRVLPVSMRRWLHQPRQLYKEAGTFLRQLREYTYDRVIDAQGLLKSALLTALAHGPSAGYNLGSARESIATLFYQYRFDIDRNLHAILRNRQLFAMALNYELPNSQPDFGIKLPSQDKHISACVAKQPYLIFLHSTTWKTKHWPTTYWRDLVVIAGVAGHRVLLPWGNHIERQRADYIAAAHDLATVLPLLSLHELAHLLTNAQGVVALDTGLAHLATVLSVPCVGIYGASDTARTSLSGTSVANLKADLPCVPCRKSTCQWLGYTNDIIEPLCMYSLTPSIVWKCLQQQLYIHT